MSDDDYLYLTTTGRRSKRKHRIEIWYARDDDHLYLLAGGGRESDWVRNLEAHPRVTLCLGKTGADLGATGRILDAGDPDEERARRLVFDKYQDRYHGDLERWRSSALPVVLVLDEP
ncbi:MAG: nitroreductase family deazaflavin-dependent oxidoreductase [Acidimicrobiales bacterium]|nr:nitroreductase family deazaflavin-dependent oxidoreductase [Acidimicrobiales bacterium]